MKTQMALLLVLATYLSKVTLVLRLSNLTANTVFLAILMVKKKNMITKKSTAKKKPFLQTSSKPKSSYLVNTISTVNG